MSHTFKKQFFFIPALLGLCLSFASHGSFYGGYDADDLSDAMAAVGLARRMQQQRRLDALERAALAEEQADERRRQRRIAQDRADERAEEQIDRNISRAKAILSVCKGLNLPFTEKMKEFDANKDFGPLAEDVCTEFGPGHLKKCQRGVHTLLSELESAGIHLLPETKSHAQKFLSEGRWRYGKGFFKALGGDPNYQGRSRSSSTHHQQVRRHHREEPHRHREEARPHHRDASRGHAWSSAAAELAHLDEPCGDPLDTSGYCVDFLGEVLRRVQSDVLGQRNLSKTEKRLKKILDEGSEDADLPFQLGLRVAEDRGFLQDMTERGTGVWADDSY